MFGFLKDKLKKSVEKLAEKVKEEIPRGVDRDGLIAREVALKVAGDLTIAFVAKSNDHDFESAVKKINKAAAEFEEHLFR